MLRVSKSVEMLSVSFQECVLSKHLLSSKLDLGRKKYYCVLSTAFFWELGISFTNNHLPSEEPSPRVAVLIPYELREAVHLLEANLDVL